MTYRHVTRDYKNPGLALLGRYSWAMSREDDSKPMDDVSSLRMKIDQHAPSASICLSSRFLIWKSCGISFCLAGCIILVWLFFWRELTKFSQLNRN
ncbi:hypothetical protein ASPVEDRAFT_543221 [Aspergillus versicolor CBS 583.65]|uniref:Uncharacterized protein n=1 Tax=Aspergillus versicolor CBS 583.65 TaxID=1036611 RepID=A0A1L9PF36_ASPVE|nr:uncharacterized protein ASPVEDRAFT_543221 [Aspergillus versicolor CBS 583.65]OJJ00082.1 hypothetical protein ASPVEDRAFT_543221 [Aspergillus versicolor CBS 583.65]